MPCDSSYMEPTSREKQLQETAQLLVYVRKALLMDVPFSLAEAANNCYGRVDFVPQLCKAIRTMSPSQQEQIIYNARSRMARRLADWWEAHQEADRKREALEAAEARKKLIRRRALAKLTAGEREALGYD